MVKLIKKHGIIIGILLLAFFLRVYRLADLLGFYYDQGRDALAIWDLLHKGNFFLIGPTTGIEGIFLGPFYYYLITPLYWLGQGDPLWPAVFLILLNVVAIFVIFQLGKKYFNYATGIVAAGVAALSMSLIGDNRWLSNPNPLTLTSVLIFLLLGQVIQGKSQLLPWAVFLMGVGLHFEAASAVFFIPALLITLTAFRAKIKLTGKIILVSGLLFGLTLLPQLAFDFRNDHLLLKSFQKFLVTERSFSSSPLAILLPRLTTYLYIFTDKFIPATFVWRILFFVGMLVVGVWQRNIFKNEFFRMMAIWILTPLAALLLYSGNKGYVWGYYFTGIYPLIILAVTAIVVHKKHTWLLTGFLLVFLFTNGREAIRYYSQPLSSPTLVSLGTSLAAVDWVYQDANGRAFNTDVYVPPIISYAYDYLFLWRGVSRYSGQHPTKEIVERLYTIEEVDLDHEVLLNAWLARQAGFSSIDHTEVFGGVTARRRVRHTLNP